MWKKFSKLPFCLLVSMHVLKQICRCPTVKMGPPEGAAGPDAEGGSGDVTLGRGLDERAVSLFSRFFITGPAAKVPPFKPSGKVNVAFLTAASSPTVFESESLE